MLSAALPLAACNPFFVKEKPFDGPWNNAFVDVLVRPPGILKRIVDTQSRKFRRITVAVHMLWAFARAARVGTDGWF